MMGSSLRGVLKSRHTFGVKDGKAEIRDASDIWELNTYQTQERIRIMNGVITAFELPVLAHPA